MSLREMFGNWVSSLVMTYPFGLVGLLIVLFFSYNFYYNYLRSNRKDVSVDVTYAYGWLQMRRKYRGLR